MIFIKKVLNYFKLYGVFLLVEVLICFFMGLFNLIGMNTSLLKILSLIFNLAIFLFYGFNNGKKTKKKGLLEGLFTGGILVTILFLISIIFFDKIITIATLFYYIALIFSSTVGATVGKNRKKDSTV